MIEFLMQLDRDLFLFLNGLNAPWLDPVMFYISERFFWIPFYIVLLAILTRYYAWKVLLILLFIVLLVVLTDQISVLIKDTVQRYRPSRDPSLEELVHIVNGRRGGRFGFVSSHASNSFGFAVFMIFLLRKHLRYIAPVMLSWAFLKTYSRLYLGVHYPGDLIFGALLGVLCAWFVIWLWKMVQKNTFLTPK